MKRWMVGVTVSLVTLLLSSCTGGGIVFDPGGEPTGTGENLAASEDWDVTSLSGYEQHPATAQELSDAAAAVGADFITQSVLSSVCTTTVSVFSPYASNALAPAMPQVTAIKLRVSKSSGCPQKEMLCYNGDPCDGIEDFQHAAHVKTCHTFPPGCGFELWGPIYTRTISPGHARRIIVYRCKNGTNRWMNVFTWYKMGFGEQQSLTPEVYDDCARD